MNLFKKIIKKLPYINRVVGARDDFIKLYKQKLEENEELAEENYKLHCQILDLEKKIKKYNIKAGEIE